MSLSGDTEPGIIDTFNTTSKYLVDILNINDVYFDNIPDKRRNAPLRTVQLSGKSQVIGQFSLYKCKCMSGTAELHFLCN